MGLIQTIAPESEPLSLDEAKAQLRISDDTGSDDLITSLIVAAREAAETWTRRQFVRATWQMTLDHFPGHGCWFVGDSRFSGPCNGEMYLHRSILFDRPPLVSVTSIQYVDTNGVTQTLDPTKYQVSNTSEPGKVMPAYAQTWPATRQQGDAVTITYQAGYAADRLPARVKHLMRLMVGHWFYNRIPVEIKTQIAEMPLAVQALVSSLSWGDYR